MMNILFITDLYPVKDEEKTTPRTLFDFVKEWEKAGHKVCVIKPNFVLNSFLRGKPFYKTDIYENILNINYWTPFWGNVKTKIEGRKVRRYESKQLNENSLSSYLPNILSSDIVIAHMPSGILFADKLDLPFVAGIHSSDLIVLTNPLYKIHFRKRLEKALYNAKAIACRSYVIKDKLLKLFPEFKNKTFVAPSGVDKSIVVGRGGELINENSLPSYPPTFLSSKKLKILTCANFKKRKNIDKVIKACKGLENIELTVIGDGKGRKKLEKIDKNVKFTGRLSHEEVLSKMRESDIFILPSTNETFGMVYLEAMASGCITVCTIDDGVSGIIKNGENGFLTLPDETEIKKLILHIKNLDENTLKTIRENSFQTILKYTSEKCADNYLQQILKFL